MSMFVTYRKDTIKRAISVKLTLIIRRLLLKQMQSSCFLFNFAL